MTDLISIVVPVYNAADYIENTLRMVVAQTWKNWELILVDDKSPDGSGAYIEELLAKEDFQSVKDRVRLISKEQNEGAARARNTGILEAKGEYLAFVDADDVWAPEKLASQIAFMKEHDAAFSCTAYEFGDENAVGTGRFVHPLPVMTYKKALTRTIIFTSTVMFDLHQLTKEEILMPICPSEDTALWWQLLRTGHPCYGLDEVLTIYRRPAKSLSSNKGVAIKRIWYLYREREHLSLIKSLWCMAGWAVRATLRRI